MPFGLSLACVSDDAATLFCVGVYFGLAMKNNISKGTAFENRCLDLLQELGFAKLQLTKLNDQGADVVGFLGADKYVFQCKNHMKKQGNRAVQQAIAARGPYLASRCGVISESDFTKSAYQLAQPNYCLLFTASELTVALDSGKTFADMIKGYEFPNHVSVEHDYEVIKKYEEIKAKIGHTPRNSDIDPTTRYHIKKKYGNLTNLVNQLGDTPFTKKPSNKEVKQEYRRIKQAIRKTPTLADIEHHSDFSRNCFSSYPFTQLQKDCGDAPNIERGVSKGDLITAFQNLENQLGRIPTLKELDEKGRYKSSYYRNRWGNLDNFLKEQGISKRHFKKRKYDERELALIYLLLKKVFEIRQDDGSFSVNHTVLENLKYAGETFVSPSTFSKRFGGWDSFLEALGTGATAEISKELDEVAAKFLAADLDSASHG